MAAPRTVDEYLSALPPDRREAVEAVRAVVNRSLPPGYEEGIQYGAIGWYVPHSIYPAGYHCDPKQPLPFGGLASRKQALSLSFLCTYLDPERRKRFVEDWKKTGKRLDMGAACITFKSADDLALDVIADTLARVPVSAFVRQYESLLAKGGGARAAKTGKASPKAKAKPASRARAAASAPKKARGRRPRSRASST